MASSIRYCPPIRCKVGEPITLNLEGFQLNVDRGCLSLFTVVGRIPGTGASLGGLLFADSATFTPTSPGKFVIRALCCCTPPNGQNPPTMPNP